MLSIKDGEWMNFPVKMAEKACSNIVAHYSDEGKNKEKGLGREQYALRILSHLEATISLAPCGSEADCRAKWDILITLNGKVYPLQIKSSQDGRLSFEDRNPELNGRAIPHCPCLVLEDKLERAFLGYNVLLQIISLFQDNNEMVALKPEVKAAITQYKKLKSGGTKAVGKSIQKVVFPGNQIQILKDLGLGCNFKGSFHLF